MLQFFKDKARSFKSIGIRWLTRIRLPGFRRVYCADPNIAFLGLNMQSLQLAALKQRVQLIWFDRHEQAAHFGRLPVMTCEDAENPELRRFIEYSVAVDAECQLGEVAQAIHDGRGNAKKYAAHASKAQDLFQADLHRYRPHLILLAQGYGVEAVVARRLAVEASLPVLAFENTALKDRVLWEPVSGVTVNRNLSRNLYWRYMDWVTPEEVDGFCNHIIASTKQNKQEEHSSPETAWKPNSDKPVVLYLGQVYTDSSLLYGGYSGLFPEQVVRLLYDWCASHEAQLVLKLHPKEANGIAPVTHRPYNKLTLRKIEEAFSGTDALDQDWVTIDSENQLDTYSLIEAADVVVTINSQAGLEAAIRGKNVITTGRCFYAGLDFTLDVASPEVMEIVLKKAMQNQESPERTARARKFFYVFFKKYCIAKEQFSLVRLFRRVATFNF